MAFCKNCGAKTEEGVKFCPSCGAETGAAPAGQSDQTEQNTGYTPPVAPGAPEQADIRDAQDNKVMSILAYILFFIPLLTGAHKTSPFVKFHTNQGTVLFIATVVWSIAYGILSAILLFIPIIGWLLIFILSLTGFLFLVLCIVGIINAANGKMKPLPLIGGIEIIK